MTLGTELPPVAPLLMQSLRAVGYTTPAALADLVDNSIAANARTVSITFGAHPEPLVAVVDDGEGMDEGALVSAMRFGSRDPRDARAGNDLGRFGLGLKTASLSQCRRLTVASMRSGRLAAATWDLDECEQRGTWWLARPDPDTVPAAVRLALGRQGHGTAVIWQRLDRLTSPGPDAGRRLESAMNESLDHLAMVFHRFLSGEFTETFEITINDRALPRLDPFLENHARGQTLHPESFTIEGHEVRVSPFVLPFPSRLGAADLNRAGGRESIKAGHGFYIYRGGRLVVPGGWFRIVPSDELIRLARIRVDVPVELDHLWKVDIRKTAVEPPTALRPVLRRIVGSSATRSRRVYTHRGTPAAEGERVPLWIRHDLRDDAATWRVNRQHPLVESVVASTSDDVERLLTLLERCLPVHEIHIHMSNDLPVDEEQSVDAGEMAALAARLKVALHDRPGALQRLADTLHLTEPFNRDPDLARHLAQGLVE